MTSDVNNLDGLTRSSPQVFVGRLRAKRSEKDANGRIVTRNELEVERMIAGTLPGMTITLSVLGGTVEGETMRVSHTPEFTADRRYIVFADASRTTYDPVTGGQQGVFQIVGEAVYTYDGRAVLGVENGVLRIGVTALGAADAPATTERGSAQVENPRTSGAIVSTERATDAAETPMTLEGFSRAVTAAARR